jgi:hypothetical protein
MTNESGNTADNVALVPRNLKEMAKAQNGYNGKKDETICNSMAQQ